MGKKCKACGACEKPERCECCGKCANCGQAHAFPDVAPLFPQPAAPQIVPMPYPAYPPVHRRRMCSSCGRSMSADSLSCTRCGWRPGRRGTTGPEWK